MEEELLKTAIAAARAGADVLQSYFRRDGLQVSRKGQNDFVTEADKASEAAVLAEIQRSFPDHRIALERRKTSRKMFRYMSRVDRARKG